jgi:hypothetical protein
LSNYCLRESCYKCKFNKISAADLKIGDFWGNHFSDDSLGTSICIPLTAKGYDLIVGTTDLYVQSMPSDILYESQSIKDGLRFNVPYNNNKVLESLKNGKGLKNTYLKYKYPNYLINMPKNVFRRILPRRFVNLIKKLL